MNWRMAQRKGKTARGGEADICCKCGPLGVGVGGGTPSLRGIGQHRPVQAASSLAGNDLSCPKMLLLQGPSKENGPRIHSAAGVPVHSHRHRGPGKPWVPWVWCAKKQRSKGLPRYLGWYLGTVQGWTGSGSNASRGPGSINFCQVSASTNFAVRVHVHARICIVCLGPVTVQKTGQVQVKKGKAANGARQKTLDCRREGEIVLSVRDTLYICTQSWKKEAIGSCGAVVSTSSPNKLVVFQRRQLKVTDQQALLRLARHLWIGPKKSGTRRTGAHQVSSTTATGSARRCRGAYPGIGCKCGLTASPARCPALQACPAVTHSLPLRSRRGRKGCSGKPVRVQLQSIAPVHQRILLP